ncbi:hypothetical protein VRU48_04820 [Pedobacter sp. KR3-3]|uniref:RNA-binding protein n=1 Tax=Pedobacter albus TaxID=3113905 RepID=A0ABU7I4T8_9SPHI|nr:hypothetical protein [Pedobacter sp. KR3-3]MEE1944419.1 hypothetical protein [Pedobacter sp. KR3-3]
MAVLHRKEEKIQVVLGRLPKKYTQEEFTAMFIKLYSKDWGKIKSAYIKQSQDKEPGTIVRMPKPDLYLKQLLENYLQNKDAKAVPAKEEPVVVKAPQKAKAVKKETTEEKPVAKAKPATKAKKETAAEEPKVVVKKAKTSAKQADTEPEAPAKAKKATVKKEVAAEPEATPKKAKATKTATAKAKKAD